MADDTDDPVLNDRPLSRTPSVLGTAAIAQNMAATPQATAKGGTATPSPGAVAASKVKPGWSTTPPLFPTPYNNPLQLPGPKLVAPFVNVRDDKRFNSLPFAVVDLTKVHPEYLGHHEDDQQYIGSLAKIAIMYAAFELHSSVQTAIRGQKAPDGRVLLQALEFEWSKMAKPLREQKPSTWPPSLNQIFKADFDASINEWSLEFQSRLDYAHDRPGALKQLANYHSDSTAGLTRARKDILFRDWLELAIGFSDNNGASLSIEPLGFQFINASLTEAGLYDSKKGGLWLGSFYGKASPGGVFLKSDFTRWGKSHEGTARALAKFMALVFLNELVHSAASTEMRIMMDRLRTNDPPVPGYTGSWFVDALQASGRKLNTAFSKLGITDGICEAGAFVEIMPNPPEGAPPKDPFSYVLACAHAEGTQKGVQTLNDLAVKLADCVKTANS